VEESSSNRNGRATCILCGKPFADFQTVKFRDWWVHAECAQSALEKQVDGFNRTPFRIGSLGIVFSFLLSIPIYAQYHILINNPIFYGVPFLGMAIGLLFQVFGLYGFASNYDEGIGVICAFLAALSAILHLAVAGLVLGYGHNPNYYDPETGAFIVLMVPGVSLTMFAAFALLSIMMALIGIMILLLGESFTPGIDNRVIAVLFIGAAALMPLTPVNFFLEMILITILMVNAGIPTEWRKIEFE